MNFGGRAALNLGNVYGDDTSEIDWSFGFNAGVLGKVQLINQLFVVPELSVDLRRLTASEEGVDLTVTTWALDIPVALRFYALPQFFLEFGPTFDFILSSETELEIGGVKLSGDNDYDTFEFGFVGGLGAAILPNLDVNFRVAFGVTESIGTTKNLQFQLGATYWFI